VEHGQDLGKGAHAHAALGAHRTDIRARPGRLADRALGRLLGHGHGARRGRGRGPGPRAIRDEQLEPRRHEQLGGRDGDEALAGLVAGLGRGDRALEPLPGDRILEHDAHLRALARERHVEDLRAAREPACGADLDRGQAADLGGVETVAARGRDPDRGLLRNGDRGRQERDQQRGQEPHSRTRRMRAACVPRG
jgi:hypothetical protein